MKFTLRQFITAYLSFLVIESLWVGYIATWFYQQEVGPILRGAPGFDANFIAALVVWVFLAGGICYFALNKKKDTSLKQGAAYGLVVYGVYGLTNLTVLAEWTVLVTIVDTLWGVVLCTMVTALTYKFGK